MLSGSFRISRMFFDLSKFTKISEQPRNWGVSLGTLEMRIFFLMKQQCTWSGAVPVQKSKPRKAKVPIGCRRDTDNSSRMSNLEDDLQALKEGFIDMAQGQHGILELVRESASTMDQCLQALERRFANLEGTLVNLMRVALGVKEGEEENQGKEKDAPKELEEEEQ
ncbi:hypothetical protein EV361DRAFT_1021457 [Lentinula raphanica]|nr:hypothetical protein EV361DRAFT_1021457 [Lentinula raphanica]